MQAWHMLVVLWLLFAATHLGMSHTPVRSRLIDRLGKGGFMGVYSLVSVLIFVPLVWLYFSHRHEGPLLWQWRNSAAVYHTAMGLSFVAIVAAVASYLPPAPTSMAGGKGKAAPYGLTRITRHPLFMALALWGAAHSVLNGFASDVVFFLGFTLFGLLGSWHQDVRKRHMPSMQDYYQVTGFWPFSAQLSRRGGVVIAELPWLGFVVGAVVAVAAYHLHKL